MTKKKGKTGKKNPGVGIDFKKAKYKVGKKLPKAQNETSLDFKTQQIAVPQQLALLEKGNSTALSERNLTTKELLHRLGHHNAKQRMEAVRQLKDLLNSNPQEFFKDPGLILEQIFPLLLDHEQDVRLSFITLLKETLSPLFSEQILEQKMALLMSYILPAMADKIKNIKAAAFEALLIITEAAPSILTHLYGYQCIDRFLDVLDRRKRVSSAAQLSLDRMMLVLDKLNKFLQLIFEFQKQQQEKNSEKLQFAKHRNSRPFTSHEILRAYEQELRKFDAIEFIADAEASMGQKYRNLENIAQFQQKQYISQENNSKVNNQTSENTNNLSDVYGQLISTLVDCWKESVPNELISSTPQPESVRCLSNTVNCMNLILKICPDSINSKPEIRKQLIQSLLPFFPLDKPHATMKQFIASDLIQHNYSVSNVVLNVVLNAFNSGENLNDFSPVLQKLCRFYVSVFENISRAKNRAADVIFGVQKLFPVLDLNSKKTFSNFVFRVLKISEQGSELQISCLEFLHAWVRQPEKIYLPDLRNEVQIPSDLISQFVQILPQIIWESGRKKQQKICLKGLKIFHDVVKYLPNQNNPAFQFAQPIIQQINQIQMQLLPLFGIVTEIKPKNRNQIQNYEYGEIQMQNQQKFRFLMGPVGKFDDGQIQFLAVDILYFFPGICEDFLHGLTTFILGPWYGENFRSRLFQTIMLILENQINNKNNNQIEFQEKVQVFLQFVSAIIAGKTEDIFQVGAMDQNWEFCTEISQNAAKSLLRLSDKIQNVESVVSEAVWKSWNDFLNKYNNNTVQFLINNQIFLHFCRRQLFGFLQLINQVQKTPEKNQHKLENLMLFIQNKSQIFYTYLFFVGFEIWGEFENDSNNKNQREFAEKIWGKNEVSQISDDFRLHPIVQFLAQNQFATKDLFDNGINENSFQFSGNKYLFNKQIIDQKRILVFVELELLDFLLSVPIQNNQKISDSFKVCCEQLLSRLKGNDFNGFESEYVDQKVKRVKMKINFLINQ